MTNVENLVQLIREKLSDKIISAEINAANEITIEVKREFIQAVSLILRDDNALQFKMLIDICGVDYSDYGKTEWQTEETTAKGFSRGVDVNHHKEVFHWEKPRFAVVYHLLSIQLNQRVRLKIFTDDEPPIVDSVINIWPAADWYEREAFDLFGILFIGHPDLRRILTDYGFIGHPFRKDFPLIGNVEMRYDAAQQRCVYEPVSIQPRVLVPKVIRTDNRYLEPNKEEGRADG